MKKGEKRPQQAGIATKGTCRYCGAEVVWVRGNDGFFSPPKVDAGSVLCVLDPIGDEETVTVRHARILIRHRCREEDVKEVQEFKARQRAEHERQLTQARKHRKELVEYSRTTRTMAEQAYDIALAVTCPACGQERNLKCLNLNRVKERKGFETSPVHTKFPHPDRVVAAEVSKNEHD